MFNFVSHPEDTIRLGDFLIESLNDPKWLEFRAAVAFVKRSGTTFIKEPLTKFSLRAKVRFTAGIDAGGTSIEGLADLVEAAGPHGSLWIFHNSNGSTFHPKVYLFKNEDEAEVIIGSGNLTKGGLFENYEAGIHIRINRSNSKHAKLLASIEASLDKWSTAKSGLCHALDAALLKSLALSGELMTEVELNQREKSRKAVAAAPDKKSIFRAWPVQSAPKAPHSNTSKANSALVKKANSTGPTATAARTASTAASEGTYQPKFVMTLQNTDVGSGQKTKGAAKRSPEIFVPILAVDKHPNFWGWPQLFTPDAAWAKENKAWIAEQKAKKRRVIRPLDKMDRVGVRIKLPNLSDAVVVTMWYNPDKKDIRMRHKLLRSAGHVGDILLFQQAPYGRII